ncbi:MAG: SCP-like extracellular [Phenylobacterium sp.]|nr:SCP-like extracellular [Phenylobacterium sp.]
MLRLGVGILFTVSAFLVAVAAPVAACASQVDDAVLAELNQARQHPAQYARSLQIQRVTARQEAGDDADPNALAEAIEFLERQAPLEPLSRDPRLDAAAADHVAAQGASGQVGHGEFARRLRSHVMGASLAGEDIYYGEYGEQNAREVVRRLIVDKGVPDRGHRANIFGAGFQAGGVSCGPHAVYGSMCVIDFAGGQLLGRAASPQSLARSW